jgi:hypothetical protein
MRLFCIGVTAIFICIAVAFSVQPVKAQNVSQESVIKNASSKLMETLLNTLNINYKEVGNGSYGFTIKGYKVLLFNKGDDIQLCAVFSGNRVSLNRINEWNREKRFSRAYLDKDGDAVIEADLDFDGGVTGETLLRFIAVFVQSVESFSTHIEYRTKSD